MKYSYFIILGILILIGIIFIPNTLRQNNNGDKNLITTSFYPLFFFTSEIVKDKAEVYNVTPAGVEPHDYDLSAGDRAKIENSTLLILNGGNLEPWAENVIQLKDQNTKIIITSDGLIKESVLEDGIRGPDPHVWLNPLLAKKQAEKISIALSEIDSDNSSFYQSNFEELAKKFDELNTKFKEGLSNCKKRNIVTSHVAFNYLADGYGLRQVSISGISPEEEPSAADLARVADFARRNNVNFIFFESLVSPRLAETIAREVGAQTLVLNPLEGLTDEEISEGENYFSIMEGNLNNLKLALECQ